MDKEVELKCKSLKDNLGYLLWQTTMLWQRQMNRILDEINLTHTQFVILASVGWLSMRNDNVNQKDIAEDSKTDRMMVSKILRTLQKNGLIDRNEHETDTRAKCVLLTEKGKDVLQNAIEISTQSNDLFFSKLSDKMNFRKELRNIIGLYITNK